MGQRHRDLSADCLRCLAASCTQEQQNKKRIFNLVIGTTSSALDKGKFPQSYTCS